MKKGEVLKVFFFSNEQVLDAGGGREAQNMELSWARNPYRRGRKLDIC
jgi:hypothetical protein